MANTEKQEPYCWTWDVWISGGNWEARYGWEPYCGGKRPAHSNEAKPLYEAPPQREKFGKLYEELRQIIDGGSESMTHEDALKELKYLVALAEKHQPVAWWDGAGKFASPKEKDWDKRTGGILSFGCDIPVYTAPPQREWCQCDDAPNDCTYEKNCRVPQIDDAFKRIEWQGLTDEERRKAWNAPENYERPMDFARAIEAKLKEKNT